MNGAGDKRRLNPASNQPTKVAHTTIEPPTAFAVMPNQKDTIP